VISEGEVADWKHHPVTMEFFTALRHRIEGLKDEIVDGTISADPRLLAWKAGAITAIADILDTEF
jgi:hypothetical protein